MKRSPLLFIYSWVPFILAGFCACSSPTRYRTDNRIPLAPILRTIAVSTKNDTLPCIRVSFEDTNVLAVSMRIDRTGPNSENFTPQLRRVPKTLGTYLDEDYPALYVKDYDRYQYRLYAETTEDSISPASNPGSIYLTPPPDSLSVFFSGNIPAVRYRVDGERGLSFRTEVVKDDTVLAQINRPESFSTGLQTDFFDSLPRDTLISRSTRRRDNGTYGVRIIAIMGVDSDTAFGIAVGKFNVFQ